ncbi:MAG: hypothetical protein KF910_09965 [Brevundimonas sp.]|nr:hypothetical protein [Brevundimonas sp.]
MRAWGLALLLGVAACAPVAEESAGATQTLTADECATRGGQMRPVGRMQSVRCVLRYADAGKPCTDGAQCQGDCRVEGDAAPREGQQVQGRCQVENVRFGCFTTIENGRAQATLCID